ncbi:hypothetical protein H4R33_000057 [Dimargaris cristalligena]|nr:hypothetical protein H4R33_000057 [Dimargaris cristalligena]
MPKRWYSLHLELFSVQPTSSSATGRLGQWQIRLQQLSAWFLEPPSGAASPPPSFASLLAGEPHPFAGPHGRRVGPIHLDLLQPTMSNHPRSATPVPADTVLRGRFVANNLEIDSADYPWGVVHLYRDSEPPQTTQTVAASPQPGTLLAILAVPTYMSAADVLSFLGGYREAILHIRTIRDQHPNRYLALLQFQTPSDADHFYTTYSGRAFSSLEPEKCHVVYVNEVLVQPSAVPDHALPLFLDATGVPADSAEARGSDESTAPVVPARLLELPTCPVCLESLDSSATGLMTILCQHTFHCQCLFRWGDGSCPVCRYSANRRRTGSTETTPNVRRSSNRLPVDPVPSPVLQGAGGGAEPEGTESTTPLPEALPTHLSGSSDDDLETQCAHCGARDHLWICLICAHIGCGRYQAGHAHQHFEATGHLYSLELESQRVWDYANEGYVHRLIQNRADGKLVELPEPNSPSPSGTVGLEEKVQSLNTEFAGLLDSQLESQRQFYESQIDNLARDWYHTVEELRATRRERSQWMKKYQEAQQTNQSTRTHLLELETTKHRFDKRVDKLSAQVAKLEQRWTEEAELNKALSANQSTLKGELAAKDQTIAELQEQVQDLMAYLSMQQKVASDTSLQGADVVGVSTRPSPASSAAARATPTKGRKKK